MLFDKRHQIHAGLFDRLVVDEAQFLFGFSVLIRELIGVHIHADEYLRYGQPFIEHIAVEQDKVRVRVDMGVVVAAEAVEHIGHGVGLVLVIACREQDVDLLVISCDRRIIGYVLLQGAVVYAALLLEHLGSYVVAVRDGIGIIAAAVIL